MSEAPHPSVSVIVAAHDAAHELPLLFAALRRQTAPAESFELILVDDRSVDATADLAAAEPGVVLLRSAGTRGPYPARNLAAQTARGDLLAFTDADCVPAPDWIERGIAEFADPAVDLIGGDIRMPLGSRPSVSALLDAARHLDQERYVREGYGATANMWVRRTVFDAVGGFNDRLISAGDSDFGKRATAAGHRLRFAPDAVVEHPPRTTAREIVKKGYRLGIGSAQRNAHGDGTINAGKPMWREKWAYVPPRRLEGRHRLRRVGQDPGPFKTAQILAAQYVVLTGSIVVGSAVGSMREHRRRRGT